MLLFAKWLSRPVAASPSPMAVEYESTLPVIQPPSVIGILLGSPEVWTIPVTGERQMHFRAKGI